VPADWDGRGEYGVSKEQTHKQREIHMSVAKVTEITSGSPKSFEAAIEQGLKRAEKTLDAIQGAWIKEQKVVWSGSKVSEYRVTMKVTFVLKE
jgi:hypothetical protein